MVLMRRGSLPKAKTVLWEIESHPLPEVVLDARRLSLPGVCDRVVESPHGERMERTRWRTWRNWEPGSRWPKEGFLRMIDPAWGSVLTKCLSTCGAKAPFVPVQCWGAGDELQVYSRSKLGILLDEEVRSLSAAGEGKWGLCHLHRKCRSDRIPCGLERAYRHHCQSSEDRGRHQPRTPGGCCASLCSPSWALFPC